VHKEGHRWKHKKRPGADCTESLATGAFNAAFRQSL
jgi:hypothetical protein